MNTEHEGKSFAEHLGIDKPEGWVSEQWDVCQEALGKDGEIFSALLNKFLLESGQIKFLMVTKLNNGEESLSRVTRLFYAMGYMRGKIAEEKDGELDKLWGKEENNEEV